MDPMLRKALRKYNGLRQQVDNVLLGEDGEVWEAQLRNFLAKRSCWVSGQATESTESRAVEKTEKVADTTFTVSIDYSHPLSAMIAAGQYDGVNSDITPDHFPITGTGTKEVDVTLFHFNRSISSDKTVKELDQAGFRPATIEELLALGAKHTDLQRKFPIVALGSVWRYADGRRYVAHLREWQHWRKLDLCWWYVDWDPFYRFLAVRKS